MEKSTESRKKLIFITQSKGGCGKSVLAFLLAQKYPDAIIVDMDDATKTTSMQLAYRKPIQITFLSSNKNIDRSKFNKFLEFVSSSESEMFICDLGASISEQLPYYLNDVKDFLPEILEGLSIELVLCNVVGGSNIFIQTMSYLNELHESVKGIVPIKIFKNEYFEFTDAQNKQLDKYAKEQKSPIVSFTISKDKNEEIQETLLGVLKSGEGVESQGIVTKMYFKNSIKTIEV